MGHQARICHPSPKAGWRAENSLRKWTWDILKWKQLRSCLTKEKWLLWSSLDLATEAEWFPRHPPTWETLDKILSPAGGQNDEAGGPTHLGLATVCVSIRGGRIKLASAAETTKI